MRLEIKGLAELRARLERLRPADIMAAALAAEAERLAQSVRDGLATPPMSGDGLEKMQKASGTNTTRTEPGQPTTQEQCPNKKLISRYVEDVNNADDR